MTNHPPEHHFYLLLAPRVDQKCPSGCFKGSAVRRLLSPNCLAETTGRFRPEAPEMAVQSQNRCLSGESRSLRSQSPIRYVSWPKICLRRLKSDPPRTEHPRTAPLGSGGALLLSSPPPLPLLVSELAKAAIQQQEAKNGSREGEKGASHRR